VQGGREINRTVDLATMPLYMRAGAVLPMGPLQQNTDEPSDGRTTLIVYPGKDGQSTLYEDDGHSFDHRRGEYIRMAMVWQDSSRRLTLRLAAPSRLLPPTPRQFNVRVAGSTGMSPVTFTGRPVEIKV